MRDYEISHVGRRRRRDAVLINISSDVTREVYAHLVVLRDAATQSGSPFFILFPSMITI